MSLGMMDSKSFESALWEGTVEGKSASPETDFIIYPDFCGVAQKRAKLPFVLSFI